MSGGDMGAGERMALKSIIVKGKEYRANKITEVIMREGKVFIKYLPSVMGNEKRIEAKFKDVKFVDEDGGKMLTPKQKAFAGELRRE